jgi:hypothetical protein
MPLLRVLPPELSTDDPKKIFYKNDFFMETLKRNDSGAWVRELQKLLITAGFPLSNTGTLDPPTEDAVKEFQRRHQLLPDGIVNGTTWNALGWNGSVEEKQLKEADIVAVANDLRVEVPSIKAVFEVEARGKGFLSDGRPKILFEGHIFWSQLRKRGKDPAAFAPAHPDILYPRWTKEHYKGGVAEYDRLSRAQGIEPDAALASASWGTFQIMGFNYKLCGYNSVAAFVESNYRNEGEHLKAFASFVSSAGLLTALQRKDWPAFARGYNGPEYAQNKYDSKLAAAYAKHAVAGG